MANRKVKKLLIVPSERIAKNRGRSSTLLPVATWLKSKLQGGALPYDGEMQLYGDMPVILGNENVFVFGNYREHYFSEIVPEDCPYPSCCRTPTPTFVTAQQTDSVLRDVDALLVSSRAGHLGAIAIQKAKARNLLVAILDFQDHESIFGSPDVRSDLCRNFAYGSEFDLYFKKELPLGYQTQTIRPLSPMPVRPESYQFRTREQDIDIFYSGRKRLERCQPERVEIVDLVRKNFDNTLILEHETRSSFISVREYWADLSRSKMALSPSGRVWDSFRHCEVGLTETAVLLAPKPYVETVEPFLKDEENAILYDTELNGGRYHFRGGDELVDRIKCYLNDSGKLATMANNWRTDVMAGHTIAARSRYIIRCIEELF